MSNKKMTSEQKKAMEMKYEIAGELGLLEKVKKVGWKGLSSKESGKIGGIMGKRKREKQKEQKQEVGNTCEFNENFFKDCQWSKGFLGIWNTRKAIG